MSTIFPRRRKVKKKSNRYSSYSLSASCSYPSIAETFKTPISTATGSMRPIRTFRSVINFRLPLATTMTKHKSKPSCKVCYRRKVVRTLFERFPNSQSLVALRWRDTLRVLLPCTEACPLRILSGCWPAKEPRRSPKRSGMSSLQVCLLPAYFTILTSKGLQAAKKGRPSSMFEVISYVKN